MPVYNDLIDVYYRAWFRFHPEIAVELGVEGYAHLLTPYGDDDIGVLITLDEKLIDSIDELNTDELTDDQRFDLNLMRGRAMIEYQELLNKDWRISDPTRFIPVNAIYQLTVRPIKNRGEALLSRLEAIPGYLRGAKRLLRTAPERIPGVWFDAALDEASEGIDYFRTLRHHPHLQKYRLDSHLEKAAYALDDFVQFLKKEIQEKANGSFAYGRGLFELRLKHIHGLSINADELYDFGERLYTRTWQQLVEVTQRLTGSDDVEKLTATIQTKYKPKGDLLQNYKKTMHAAYDFIRKSDLISMPEKQHLHVIDTPKFLRHSIPFAAYWDPMPTDPEQTGYYYVTPPQDEASWGEHNLISMQHTCVHEAWPGHHLQFVTANQNPDAVTLPRLVNTSSTLYEGWALYSERLMYEEGFYQSEESEFILLKDQLWRALRVMLDVELHTRDLSIDDAAEKMKSSLGFSTEQAKGDLSWYSSSPTTPMGYATGCELILAAREKLKELDKEFSLRDFHDRLLSSGSVGLAWNLKHNFGEPLWDSIAQSVFK